MKRFFCGAFLGLSISLCLFSCASQKNYVPVENFHKKTEVISILNGKIQGLYNSKETVELYAGIPYAKPPVGSLRWRAPEDAENWEGVFQADHFAPEAMQTHSKFYQTIWDKYYHVPDYRTKNCPMSEDCLYLNVWKPVTEKKDLPVLVYIHGGSFTGGQSFFPEYDGEYFAEKGIVFVSIAYRLNVFGFFALDELAEENPDHSTGNYGLMDMVKALEWVHKNISSFGGNPENVTIAGESAGSSAVSAMCATPLSKNYFRRAIGESSSLVVKRPVHSFRKIEDAKEMGQNIKKEFKCNSVEDLRKIPAEKLVQTKFINNACTNDGFVLPESPFEIYEKGLNHEEALLNGFNLHEATAWVSFIDVKKSNYDEYLQKAFPENWEKVKVLYPADTTHQAKINYTDIFTTICFSYPHYSWTNQLVAQGKPVYKYCFTKQNGMYEAQHTGEIMYAYGNIPKNSKYFEDSDYHLSEIMSQYWVNFIATGNPNGNNLPEWKAYSTASEKVLEFGNEIQLIDDPFIKIYPFVE